MKVSVIAESEAMEPLIQIAVEAMGQQVAGDAGPGGIDIEAPGGGSALRHVGRDRPVLQELGPVVEDLAPGLPEATRFRISMTAGTRR